MEITMKVHRDAMGELVKAYEEYMRRLNEVKEVIKPFNEKRFDDKVKKAIAGVGSVWFCDGWSNGWIATSLDPELYLCYLPMEEIIIENRFDARRFIGVIDAYLARTEKMVAMMKKEMEDPAAIIDAYNQKVEELRRLRDGLSPHFQTMFRYHLDHI